MLVISKCVKVMESAISMITRGLNKRIIFSVYTK